jgi:hypothetical protein
LRRSILACGLLLAFAGISAAAAAASTVFTPAFDGATAGFAVAPTTTAQAAATPRALAYWRHHVERFRAGAQHWLTIIRARPVRLRSAPRTLAVHSVHRLRHLSLYWRHRDRVAFRRAHHPPLFGAWLCIHHYEGSWQDAGGPYYGGLQMDLSFQARYGGWLLRTKGTANHWTVLEQIWVAVHGWRARGFAPWPNTARYCGVY